MKKNIDQLTKARYNIEKTGIALSITICFLLLLIPLFFDVPWIAIIPGGLMFLTLIVFLLARVKLRKTGNDHTKKYNESHLK